MVEAGLADSVAFGGLSRVLYLEGGLLESSLGPAMYICSSWIILDQPSCKYVVGR